MADGNRQRIMVPSDMVAEILLRLPVKSLKRFKCVCKPWYDLISDSTFVMEHANMAKNCTNRMKVLVSMELPQSIDYEELLNHEGDGHVACKELKLDISGHVVEPMTNLFYLIYIVGSCNGLICLHGLKRLCYRHWDFVLVWNPSTGDTCRLPRAPPFRNCSYENLLPKLFGFGYDSTSEDYKVMLGNMSSTKTECITQIYLFALKTGSWRCYEDCRTIEKKGSVRMGGQGCLSNGALHWIELVFDSEGYLDGSSSRIVAFDLAEEQFREMAPLSSFIDKEYLDKIHESSDILIGIGITIENSLIVYFYHRRDRWNNDVGDTTLTVWLMKEYGNENSWTKFLSIPLKILVPTEYIKELLNGMCDDTMNDFLFPLHILEDGKVLMSCDEKKLVLYNPKENKETTVLETSLSSNAVVYVETLISPKIGGAQQTSQINITESNKLRSSKNKSKKLEEEHRVISCPKMTDCLNLNKKVLHISRKPWILN